MCIGPETKILLFQIIDYLILHLPFQVHRCNNTLKKTQNVLFTWEMIKSVVFYKSVSLLYAHRNTPNALFSLKALNCEPVLTMFKNN